MYNGHYLPLATEDIEGAQPRNRHRKRNTFEDHGIDYSKNPLLFSKKKARDIYKKNHPDTNEDLFGALITDEAIKNQFTKKNQEFATLSNYKDFLVEQAELQSKLEKRYGKSKNYDEDLAQFVRKEGKGSDAIDDLNRQIETKQHMKNSLGKDAFNFYGVDAPPTPERRSQYDYQQVKMKTSKQSQNPQMEAGQGQGSHRAHMNDPAYQNDASNFYGDSNQQAQMQKTLQQDAELFYMKGITPRQEVWDKYVHSGANGQGAHQQPQQLQQNPLYRSQQLQPSQPQEPQYSQAGPQYQQPRRKNEIMKNPHTQNKRSYLSHSTNNILQPQHQVWNNSNRILNGHIGSGDQVARQDIQPVVEGDAALLGYLKGDGEMKLPKKKRPANSILYDHHPLSGSNVHHNTVSTNKLYGAGVPVLY